MAQTVFIIEDDENIRNLVKVALTGYGYEAEAFETAEEALERMQVKVPDMAIFDLMLPGIDGLEAISRIRSTDSLKHLPVMVLTARDKEYDKVTGLDTGADDYMTKPFGILELMARIRSLLRRTVRESGEEKKEKGRKKYGSLSIDTNTREVFMDSSPVALTFKEYSLLLYLIENRSRVVSREELLDRLWDYSADIETRTLDIHIRTLRQKLGEAGSRYIRTVRSVGYRFMEPEEE